MLNRTCECKDQKFSVSLVYSNDPNVRYYLERERSPLSDDISDSPEKVSLEMNDESVFL